MLLRIIVPRSLNTFKNKTKLIVNFRNTNVMSEYFGQPQSDIGNNYDDFFNKYHLNAGNSPLNVCNMATYLNEVCNYP